MISKSQKGRSRLGLVIVLMALFLIVSMFFFAGCNNDIDGSSADQSQTDPSQNEEIIYPEHEIDPDPEPIGDLESELSLEGYGAMGALNDTDLSIADMLMYAVQDEYLAHGEYDAIINEFGNRNPYANIMRSEETHLSFLEEVYDSYNLDFPEDTSGEHLVIPKDLLEAAQTGVQAEIDNIAMYEKFLTFDLPDNIEQVFTALKNGSESHLAAFQKQVDRLSN
ncbi:ferritin-like domain-containing protein [Alkalibacter mobilis]|uniref:ferritin-like domain-containing protein n=1 Tax=Alkalibacter mobilis TaxID=2787712 RepID=UPI00189EC187|nr:DUF2202 domain-containing protein [Alkalibacter mobilis]MBF7096270.1 DUF2202 domain-containing protein [Alkalibacter mobilis]